MSLKKLVTPKLQNILVRALKTFVQGFLAAWMLTDFSFEKGAIVGACAAGFSFLMNFVVQVLKDFTEER